MHLHTDFFSELYLNIWFSSTKFFTAPTDNSIKDTVCSSQFHILTSFTYVYTMLEKVAA